MRFDPEYVNSVLNENFEDAKAQFFPPLMAIQFAHLAMLVETGIISRADGHKLKRALQSISEADVQAARYDETCEDLFYYIDRQIVDACGEDVGGRLHTARSRNDIDMTMYRMRQRRLILDLFEASLELRRVLLDLADRHRDTIFAVHTHTQRAQPTTVAHYLLAVLEQLERDAARLAGAYDRTNRCPLGACAITGTGFPINRQLTADFLGFSGPTRNTYGSIAAADYLLESAAATGVLLAGLGRVVQDLLLWSTSEFGYVRFGDGFVQCSSIMPQKRNPVAIEHARAIGSKAVGQTQAILTTLHNTPFGDVVDTEDDLQPLVSSMFHDATRMVRVLGAALATAEFDADRLEARAGEGWTTLTELADTLVRDHGISFRAAHQIAGRLMAARTADTWRPLAALLEEASASVLPAPLVYSEEALATILSARHFVAVRKTWGGPAPSETAEACAVSRSQFAADRSWLQNAVRRLTDAQERLDIHISTL
jgi:argininosuccinate lyase